MQNMNLDNSGTLNRDQGSPYWGDPINEQSSADATVSFMDLIKERAFIGEIPSEPIFEGIRAQFEDYINMEDKTNYVDVFYNQLARSYDRVKNDDSEEHPVEINEALELLHQRFIDLMQELFQVRLTISIVDLEAGIINREDLEFINRRLYEFFILDAKHNFKTAISKDVVSQIANIGDNDDEFFQRVQELMEGYNPIISTMTPTQFLQYRGEEEVYNLFANGRVNGNFLRKYTPKLYQNDELAVEIVNHITMIHQFNSDATTLPEPPEIPEEEASPDVINNNPGEDINLNEIDVNKDIEAAYNQNQEEDNVNGQQPTEATAYNNTGTNLLL